MVEKNKNFIERIYFIYKIDKTFIDEILEIMIELDYIIDIEYLRKIIEINLKE